MFPVVRVDQVGLDRADACFEVPIAALGGIARCICGGGNVGARSLGEGTHEFRAGRACGDVTTIDENVGIIAKRCANDREFVGVLAGHGGGVEGGGAELQLAGFPVGEDVDRTEARAAFEVIGHLLQAIAVGREVDDFESGCTALARISGSETALSMKTMLVASVTGSWHASAWARSSNSQMTCRSAAFGSRAAALRRWMTWRPRRRQGRHRLHQRQRAAQAPCAWAARRIPHQVCAGDLGVRRSAERSFPASIVRSGIRDCRHATVDGGALSGGVARSVRDGGMAGTRDTRQGCGGAAPAHWLARLPVACARQDRRTVLLMKNGWRGLGSRESGMTGSQFASR